ncbi:bacteriophage protein gp37 [Bradyrhizobium sp. YR681]|uniref:DUF5131 family protein n=1 Tax=Bradyrhizobium sp. YR681 TaxID=1144344 RepID=UPI0002710D23|nr:phage Gp37/Gp68 family protein [Bradyrhizobium sp. YR681]EJN11815.1 bacteriophage protein gp37 [Bradyrhizobium sp. YR681]
MADRSAIEWTDASWNPIRARVMEIQNDGSGRERIGWHCEHVSDGCRNCYAEGFNRRLGTGRDFKPGEMFREEHKGFNNGEVKLFLDEQMLTQPLRWKKPRKIFVCSMTDAFADFVTDEMLDKMFAVMALCPQHTFQVLTKRAKRMRAYMERLFGSKVAPRGIACSPWSALLNRAERSWMVANPNYMTDIRPLLLAGLQGRTLPSGPLPNAWLGISAERQQEANERIPELQKTPAAVRFVSLEPLLGPIDLEDIVRHGDGCEDHHSALECDVAIEDDQEFHGAVLDWVIVGGESGNRARPMHPDWVRGLRDQCDRNDTAFFFKQWGEWGMPTDDLGNLDWPYHPDHDRTHWFDRRSCVRPIESGWSDKYQCGGGAYPPPPFDLFQTPDYLDQVARCPQCGCGEAKKCQGNAARAAVTWVGKKKAGRLLDGAEHNAFPKVPG